MTDEQIRIAIAEACGWRFLPPRGVFDQGGYWQCGDSEGTATHNLPDFLNDLNAMAEAEKVLLEMSDGVSLPDPWSRYCDLLCKVSARGIHATARQRCEAFIATRRTPLEPVGNAARK